MGLLINIIILLTAFPVGWILASLTKEELVQGRFWFKMMLLVLIPLLVISGIFWSTYISLAILYFIIVIAISWWRS